MKSELECGLHKSTQSSEIVVGTLVRERLAQVVDCRGNGDVIGDLELVEEFPGITTTSEEVIFVKLAVVDVDVRDEGWLTDSHTEAVAFEEDIRPLEANVPGLGLWRY